MISQVVISEGRAAVEFFMASGKIKIAAPALPRPAMRTIVSREESNARHAEWARKRREKNKAKGLTIDGERRRRKMKFANHPQLILLKHDQRLYHRAWMRLNRGKPIDDLIPNGADATDKTNNKS